MTRNYYLILGLAPEATSEQIKTAYHHQVKQAHPDRSGGGSGPFLEIQEAYAVLSDPARRAAYDRAARPVRIRRVAPTRTAPAEPLIPSQAPTDLRALSLTQSFDTIRPSFEALFDRVGRNYDRRTQPKAEGAKGLHVDVLLTPNRAWYGGQIQVLVPAQVPCPICRGLGGVGPYPCGRCNRRGILVGEYPAKVSFPAGIAQHHTVGVSLESLGIYNLYLWVHFRVSDTLI